MFKRVIAKASSFDYFAKQPLSDLLSNDYEILLASLQTIVAPYLNITQINRVLYGCYNYYGIEVDSSDGIPHTFSPNTIVYHAKARQTMVRPKVSQKPI